MSDSVDLDAVTEVWMSYPSCESGITDINNCSFYKGLFHPSVFGIYFKCERKYELPILININTDR